MSSSQTGPRQTADLGSRPRSGHPEQAAGIELWKTLPAVPMAEMNGHYMGLGPDALNEKYQERYAAFMFDEKSPRGYWLGKAFRPLSETTGEGYNRWRFPAGIVKRNL